MRMSHALLCLTLICAANGTLHARLQGAAPPSRGERVIVFFAWDRPIIDGDSAARLDEMAAAIRRSPNVSLVVSGHADRSGPAAPNLRSGRERADAVAAYLAARGVQSAAMRVVSLGETRPLVATDDGVREPQNRRVEIVMHSPDNR